MSNREIIIKVLGLTDLHYGEMLMRYADLWLNKYFKGAQADEIIEAMQRSRNFWSWWSNQWNNRDCEFIRITGLKEQTEVFEGYDLRIIRELYEQNHNVDGLLIIPNKFVYKEVRKYLVDHSIIALPQKKQIKLYKHGNSKH